MIKRTFARADGPTPRRGSIAVELLLVTPILLGVLFGVVEISMMTSANEQLAAASREGCRVAALGGDIQEIERAVYNRLGNGNLCQAKITAVILEDGQGQPLPAVIALDDNGNPTVSVKGDGPGQPIPHGEPVMVRLEISAAKAVPDLLTFIGFSIKKNTLVGQTIMRKE